MSILPSKTPAKQKKIKSYIVALVYLGYGIIFLVSIFGNSAIIHIIRTTSAMKAAINFLVLNQACADLLASIICFVSVIRDISYKDCGLEEV